MKIFETKNKAKNEKKKDIVMKTVVTPERKNKKEFEGKTIQKTSNTDTKDDEKTKDSLNNENVSFFSKYTYKQLVSKKLTIVLLEGTAEVAKKKESMMKIIKSLVSSGLLIIINYGSYVTISETFDVSDLNNDSTFSYKEIVSDEKCLYDALVQLETIVNNMYKKIEEKEKEKVMVNSIEIIGIGTGTDNCSKATKKTGVESFYNATNKSGIISKYFCLTEETFIDVAEIGFHSIGSISRNYQ